MNKIPIPNYPNYLCQYNFIRQNIHEYVLYQDNWLYPEFILRESIIDPLEIKLKIKPKKLFKFFKK